MHGDEALLYDPDPGDEQRERVLRAAAACPVQAIARRPGGQSERSPQADAARRPRRPERPTTAFLRSGRIVIVGASLAGLRAAAALRQEGFTGSLTLIGDEPDEPYDRPPLSKQVLTGMGAARTTPRCRGCGDSTREWRLGVAATGLDLAGKQVRLADGGERRVRPAADRHRGAGPAVAERRRRPRWTACSSLRTRDDAARLRQRLAGRPRPGAGHRRRVHRLGDRLGLPRAGPAGDRRRARAGPAGRRAGRRRSARSRRTCSASTASTCAAGSRSRRWKATRTGGCAARTCPTAARSTSTWRWPRSAAIRNVEWLEGSGLAAGVWGVACDAGCRAFDVNGLVTDDVFVAGDVARAPAPDVRLPVPRAGALGQRGRPGRGRRAQHGQRADRPLAAPGRAGLLVHPVRHQHQVGRACPTLRRRGRHHPGLGGRPPVRRRLRLPGPHRRRGHLQPGEVAGVLRAADRAGRAVPARVPQRRPAGRRCARCRPSSRSGRSPPRTPPSW